MLNDDIRTHRARARTRARQLYRTSRTRARERIAVDAAFIIEIARAPEAFASSTRAHARPEFREQYAHAREGRVFRVRKKGGASKSTVVILLILESIKRGARQGSELASPLFFRHRAPVSAPARERDL